MRERGREKVKAQNNVEILVFFAFSSLFQNGGGRGREREEGSDSREVREEATTEKERREEKRW